VKNIDPIAEILCVHAAAFRKQQAGGHGDRYREEYGKRAIKRVGAPSLAGSVCQIVTDAGEVTIVTLSPCRRVGVR